MFAKLLKYDMKLTMRVGLPLLIAAIALALFGICNNLFSMFLQDMTLNISEWMVEGAIENRLYIVLTILISLLSLISSFFQSIGSMVLAAAYLAMVIINLVNFYKNLITDEGYLMFTLPVRPIELLSSKVLNACIWNLAAYVIVLGGAIIQTLPTYIYSIVLSIKTMKEYGIEVNIWETVQELLGISGISPMLIILFFVLAAAVSICIVIATPVFMFFTIYLGGVIAKKHKLLAGAGFTYLGYQIYSIIEAIIVFFTIGCALIPIFFLENTSGAEVINYVLIIICAILALSVIVLMAAIVLFFTLTKWLMTKKLNLP